MGGEGNIRSPRGPLNIVVVFVNICVTCFWGADSRPTKQRGIFCVLEGCLLFWTMCLARAKTRVTLGINTDCLT